VVSKLTFATDPFVADRAPAEPALVNPAGQAGRSASAARAPGAAHCGEGPALPGSRRVRGLVFETPPATSNE
jgi:hypothetical protein